MEPKSQKIFEFWEERARQHGPSHWASWGDAYLMDIEAQTISEFIPGESKVLDAGCANAYTTLKYLAKEPSAITCFDYSPKMVASAKENIAKTETAIPIKLYQADILSIPEEDASFDVSITTRVLINLPDWRTQIEAIDEMIRVTKKGGVILLSEAFMGSLNRLNELRNIFGLEPLFVQEFNKYLDEEVFESYLEEKNIAFTSVNFSSLYYLGTRVIRDVCCTDEDDFVDNYNTMFNDFFYNVETRYSNGDFGIQKLYVLNLAG